MEDKQPVTLSGVQSADIEKVWPSILPYVRDTLEYSDNKYSLQSIKTALLEKEMQLWLATQGVNILSYAITQIITYPTHKRLCVAFVGGIEMFQWIHFVNELKEWGKYHGCSAVEGYGRPGWEKALEKFGFKKIQTIYKTDI